jgi:signal peptidase I
MPDQAVNQTQRVCPSCGRPPGSKRFCGHCGANLGPVKRLPTAQEWTAQQEGRTRTRVRRRRLARVGVAVVALAAVFGVVLGVVLARRPDTRVVRVPSGSMAPTLSTGERVTVNTSQASKAPEVGDIIWLRAPAGAQEVPPRCGVSIQDGQACPAPTPEPSSDVAMLKRVIAGPGDTFALRSGRAIVNGKQLDEPYIADCGRGQGCNLGQTITVPAGHWFVLGDNRGASDDSRFWGPVPTAAILGRVDTCAPLKLFCHARH